jgi:hypothetical protein
MKTYQAGKDPVEAWGGETRAWVFDLLENPEYRRRLEALAALDLQRRPGCEPCLRALVTDKWDYESLHHLGWCESCRSASLALGMDTSSKKAGSGNARRALVVVLVAGVAIAAPLAGSQLLNRGNDDRGGVAQQTTPSTTPGTTPSTTPSTTPGTTPSTTPGTTPTTTPSTTATTPTTTATTPTTTTPVVKPVPRSRPAKGRGEQALPHTT